MTLDEFWNLIEQSAEDHSDCETMAESLYEALVLLDTTEIIGFQQHMWQRLAETYRWDLWAVAYIVNGGCSDDGFEYFRGWLIAQGRAYFEAALRDPEVAASRAEPDANECEDILYVASRAYKEVVSEPMPLTDYFQPREPSGVRWDESKIDELYPELAKKFLS